MNMYLKVLSYKFYWLLYMRATNTFRKSSTECKKSAHYSMYKLYRNKIMHMYTF